MRGRLPDGEEVILGHRLASGEVHVSCRPIDLARYREKGHSALQAQFPAKLRLRQPIQQPLESIPPHQKFVGNIDVPVERDQSLPDAGRELAGVLR
jgi:hypothetical protein